MPKSNFVIGIDYNLIEGESGVKAKVWCLTCQRTQTKRSFLAHTKRPIHINNSETEYEAYVVKRLVDNYIALQKKMNIKDIETYGSIKVTIDKERTQTAKRKKLIKRDGFTEAVNKKAPKTQYGHFVTKQWLDNKNVKKDKSILSKNTLQSPVNFQPDKIVLPTEAEIKKTIRKPEKPLKNVISDIIKDEKKATRQRAPKENVRDKQKRVLKEQRQREAQKKKEEESESEEDEKLTPAQQKRVDAYLKRFNIGKKKKKKTI